MAQQIYIQILINLCIILCHPSQLIPILLPLHSSTFSRPHLCSIDKEIPHLLHLPCITLYFVFVRMKASGCQSSVVPNLYELRELPFLKSEVHQLSKFKDKEKFVPVIRSLTYQCKNVLSKVLVYSLGHTTKDKKTSRFLQLLTEKEIMPVEELFQLMSENSSQSDFSAEVHKIKAFQLQLYQHIDRELAKNVIEFPSNNYLSFAIYKQEEDFFLKGSFRQFDYQFKFEPTDPQQHNGPPVEYRVLNALVKDKLQGKYQQLRQMSQGLSIAKDIDGLFKQFYQATHFLYDEFVLQLQVFKNYPLLRIKNYIPVSFTDYCTSQPLQGPIFSNANPECMYSHFLGYNPDSIKFIQGQSCENCQILIEQLQQNELLMMLRDNVLNPEKLSIFYCPEYNRFKLLSRVQRPIQAGSSEMITKTQIRYLNYYHFRTNIKKMTTKQRVGFTSTHSEESFPLSFGLIGREMMIMDPARGRYCQHFAFTDLREYYLNYDPSTNLCSCPIQGCNQVMGDADILYLKEVVVLIDYARFKCQEWPQLTERSRVVIENNDKKLYITYKAKEYSTVVDKVDELIDFYKTIADPYIPFPEYSLGLKEKERKERMDEYMFGGLRGEMQAEGEDEEDEDEDD